MLCAIAKLRLLLMVVLELVLLVVTTGVNGLLSPKSSASETTAKIKTIKLNIQEDERYQD
jgi:hypothetical protein